MEKPDKRRECKARVVARRLSDIGDLVAGD